MIGTEETETQTVTLETLHLSDSKEQDRHGDMQVAEEANQKSEGLDRILSTVSFSVPQDILLKETDEPCPVTYRANSSDELQLLAIADNFQRQYSHLYPSRSQLLLCPLNECGVRKFVSTTLRPTTTSHPELFTWEGCASFVADFLSLEPLNLLFNVPRYLHSSTSVLKKQRATCFEYATLLCSLLLGINYDAYCVSGYATKDMCQLDQSPQDCHLLDTEVEVVPSEQKPQENEHNTNPVKELKSWFDVQQREKKKEAEAMLLQRKKLQEENQQPPAYHRSCFRQVHCWVLVLSGSQSLQENFFIDPLTGKKYSTADDNFLGIESVWNNLNYYVNMQNHKNGCADMVYDLDDIKMWEPVLYRATSKKLLNVNIMRNKESNIIKDETDEEHPSLVFEMPRSWVNCLLISKQDLETRWPGGCKTIRYRMAELEMFAPNLQSDGLVTRLTLYKDVFCTEVVMVKERYQHRNDHLQEREVRKVNNSTSERFMPGRRFNILFHRYTLQTTGIEHEMEFSNARVDGLIWRLVSLDEMTETFKGREDFLSYRQVVFDRNVKNSDLDDSSCPKEQPLLRVVERFHRNRKKSAKEDVAERVFLMAQRRIEVTYHLEEDRFMPSRRGFVRPRAKDSTAEMVSSFQVDISEKPPTTLKQHEMLVALIKDERDVVFQIKESEKEVRQILACRDQEERDVRLHFSARNRE
ncbi:dynein regulatory complex subunit 7-like [Aulostomus maculatus]